MKLGLSPYGLALEDYRAAARAAEKAGFESFWVADHLAIPERIGSAFPYSPDGQSGLAPTTPILDPWVLLSFIAADTTSLRLATYVYILPLRHPFSPAKAAASLDILSSGRVLLGVGVGWLAEEYEAAREDFTTRGARTSEAIELMRALWTQDVVDWDGAHYAFAAAGMGPRPSAPIPILLGGHSARALRRAAELGDGWVGSPAAGPDLGRHLDEIVPLIDAALARAERSRDTFEVTSGVLGRPTDDVFAAAQAAGLDRLIVSPWGAAPGPVAIERAIDEIAAISAHAAEQLTSGAT